MMSCNTDYNGTEYENMCTALISSIGAKKNAKRAAFVHLYFNVIGLQYLVVFLPW